MVITDFTACYRVVLTVS